jgi:hypothetical protein
MARIVAITIFLCKFFFQRLQTFQRVSGDAIRYRVDVTLMGVRVTSKYAKSIVASIARLLVSEICNCTSAV